MYTNINKYINILYYIIHNYKICKYYVTHKYKICKYIIHDYKIYIIQNLFTMVFYNVPMAACR